MLVDIFMAFIVKYNGTMWGGEYVYLCST